MNHMFSDVKTIAVVGLSDKPDRPSYRVAKYMQEQGFKIIPVNPRVEEVLGERSFPSVTDIPKGVEVDLVDVFRKPQDLVPIVDEVIKRGVKAIWFQEGVVNPEAIKLAQNAGLKVEVDKCIMVEHRKDFN